jgi:hypothetical protein
MPSLSHLFADGYHSILYPQSWTQYQTPAILQDPTSQRLIRSRNAAPPATTIWKEARGPGTTRKIDPALETGRGAGAVPTVHVGKCP